MINGYPYFRKPTYIYIPINIILLFSCRTTASAGATALGVCASDVLRHVFAGGACRPRSWCLSHLKKWEFRHLGWGNSQKNGKMKLMFQTVVSSCTRSVDIYVLEVHTLTSSQFFPEIFTHGTHELISGCQLSSFQRPPPAFEEITIYYPAILGYRLGSRVLTHNHNYFPHYTMDDCETLRQRMFTIYQLQDLATIHSISKPKAHI